MRSYERFPSPQRLRQASLLVLGLAGASTGLLAGLGWRLFQDGFHDLGVRVWLVSSALVIVYLVIALLARVLATVIASRRPADVDQTLRHLQDRVDEIERELDSAGVSGVGASRSLSAVEPPVGTSAL